MIGKFELTEGQVQPVLSIRTRTSVDNLPQEIGKAYGAIMQYLIEIGEEPLDFPFCAYYNLDMENSDVEMGPVYDALSKWIAENGYAPAGTVYELYYNSPLDVPEKELLTKIVFPLK
ncbi:MAG: GyrI-like domain-containing protein [Peptococcaceae bacterium]